ncbi:MAG: type IV secretion system DNA-binding domain-containing protein [Patescibacteria group bacterium]
MAENNNSNVTYFGETNFRNEKKKFGIKKRDRARHMYIIGKTGTGKTTLLENMAIQDILNGEGVGIVDPHGEFAEKMLKFVPKNRIQDVLYFAPHDMDWPVSFNVMEKVDSTQRHLVSSGILGVFKKIWPDVWSPRMEYILNNCILALLEYPDSTLLGINRMLSDKIYREEVVNNVSDPAVKSFWTNEFAKYSDKFSTEASAAIQNKVGQFISNPLIRNIIGQPKSSFDIRDLMDGKKILLMNLSKGRIGEENSRLIGAMLITKIYLAAMSRVDIPENEREDFFLYVDEFQNFANDSFKDILAEARKYKLNLILAHQYIAQMEESIQDAVFGNVGTIITFRVGASDAESLENEFAPEFDIQDIVGLGFGSIYLKLMIDGMSSRPFSAGTLPPIKIAGKTFEEKIIEESRQQYATPKKEVEERISDWHAKIAGKTESQNNSDGGLIKKSIPHATKNNDQSQVYEAACSVCGKKTYVPFQPDGKRAIYCKTHRVASQQHKTEQTYPPDSQARIAKQNGEVAVGKEARTMNSSFKKMEVEKEEKPISLSELDHRKKAEPNLDELRKVLSGVLGDEEAENDDNREKEGGDYWASDSEEVGDEEENPIVERESNLPAERPSENENIAVVDKKQENKPVKNILKPGEKIRFG